MKSVNSDTAYDFIRQKILDGEFLPGQMLTTSVLAENIGVSRTPVRDALRQLESDGLVVIRPHFGASVKSMNFQEFCEMCLIRLALESFAAGQAAKNRSETDLQEIGSALEAMTRLTKATSASPRAELVHQDVRFHLAILSAAKNESMKREILRLNVINRIVAGHGAAVPSLSDKREEVANNEAVLKEHDVIFAAIQNSDAVGAKEAMERHIQAIIDKQIRRAAKLGAPKVTKKLTADELTYAT
jgi:DNA-binding GntR family transcriptional regulator